MAGDSATPDTSTTRTFKIPVENAAPDTHVHQGKTFKIPIESKNFNIPVEQPSAPPAAQGQNLGQQADESAASKIGTHTDLSLSAWEPTWSERVRNSIVNSAPFRTLETFAPKVSNALGLNPTDAHTSDDYLSHQGTLVSLEHLTEGVTRKQVEELLSPLPFHPEIPKGVFREEASDKATNTERYSTGFAKGVSGLTSPDMLLLQAIPVGDLLGLGGGVAKMVLPRLVTAGFGLSMAKGLVSDWKERQKAKAAGDEGAVSEIDGSMTVTSLMLLMLGHSATQDAYTTFRDRGTSATLNEHAQKVYKADYNELSDPQKAAVIYNVAADANPRVKARIDRETTRLAKVAKKSGVPTIADVADEAQARQQAYEQRAQAAKTYTQQVMLRQQRQAEYLHDANARQAAAEQALSSAERRGFPVTENREDRELLERRTAVKTSEREAGPEQRDEPVPDEPAIPVTERRSAVAEPTPEQRAQVAAADRQVQELTEQQMGQSFSALPVARQRVAAEWLAAKHPEQWEAFKGTPAYARHESDVRNADLMDAAMKRFLDLHPEGDREALAPGADIHSGVAKLILARSNIDSVLKADPETAKDLNEHSERVVGKSFDSLTPEMRGPALAEFLRAKPEKLQAFLSVDLTERIASGQHIDIANMDAEGMARERGSLRMDQRDAVRRRMDEENADRILADERSRRQEAVAATVQDAQSSRAPSLDAVYRASQGLTEMASKLGMGKADQFSDLFEIEKQAQGVPEYLRTPAVREFLTKMRQVRAAAEDHILRQVAEATAEKFRTDADGALDEASKRVVHLIGLRDDLQQAADDLRMQGQTAAADAAQQAADLNTREADAVVAGAESVQSPAPPPPPGQPRPKLVIGAATEIVTPYGTRKAHYVLLADKDVRTSHHPITFEPTKGFDQSVQKRRYESDKEAQVDITVKGAMPDGRILYSNTPQTMDGPSVVAWRPDADGNPTIIETGAGNGRKMIKEQSKVLHPDAYRSLMNFRSTRIEDFGLSESAGKIEFGEEPFDVYRLLDDPVTDQIEWKRIGEEMNTSPTKGSSSEEQGAAMASLLDKKFIDRLDDIFSSLPQVKTDDQGREQSISLKTAMRARSADIAQLLVDAGIIAPNKRTEFIIQTGENAGDLTPNAKNLIEDMLISLTVSDPKVLENASPDVKNKLARASMSFVRAKSAGDNWDLGSDNWDLGSYNSDAVKLITKADDMSHRLSRLQGKPEAVAKGAGSSSLIEKYLHTGNYQDKNKFGAEQGDLSLDAFSFTDGQDIGHAEHPATVALAMALEQTPREYSLMMAKYAEGSKPDMFGAKHPVDVFNAEIASKFNDGEGNPLHVIPEEWGSVVGLSEADKAAIEDSRGPLPVEPEVHAETVVEDVSPDSSSVTEALPEGPKRVGELRVALSGHPNLTPAEADALTEVFEHILPRAIGEDLDTLLGNRRLNFIIGGKDVDRPNAQAYQYIEDGRSIIHLCDTANTSSFIHEMAHHIRRYLNPADQAVANAFVGAKPGEAWTDAQEEKFAQAFERYHYDGGIRRGKLEAMFSRISRAMQSIYNSVTGQKLAKGSKELNAMFDNWYDWTRAERKPITARLDVEALEAAASGKVEIPVAAKMVERGGKMISDKAQPFVFVDREAFREFLRDKRNKFKGYELHNVKGEATVYALIEAGKRKLYQMPMSDTIEMARKARDLEAQLKKETDPRRQALLRGQLNGIEDKLRGSTHIFGATPPEPRDGSIIQLVHGMGEMPSMDHPTTPAEAVTAQQAYGDPTGIALGGEHGSGKRGTKADDTPGVREEGGTDRLPKQPGKADGEHGAAEGGRGAGRIATPEKNPLAKVKAAKLLAPERERGTPVVDPDKWREHVEALGLPEGTPPPTVLLTPDEREILSMYPGQVEVAEGALSALQQFDGTIVAVPPGGGKTVINSIIAKRLLGTSGDKVGLIVTVSQPLIHGPDGYMDWGHRIGLTVDKLPSDMSEVQAGGVYAATYAQIRGNRSLFVIPWDFVIFDESSSLANHMESEQGQAGVKLGYAAKKVVYSSGTPYTTVMEMGYMHKLGLWPKGGFPAWASQFGLREIAPNTYSGGSAPNRLAKLRQQLIEQRGQWQTLHMDMEGTEAQVALIPQTEEVKAGVRTIRAAFAKAAKAFEKAGTSRWIMPTLGHESIFLKRYITASKIPAMLEYAKKAIDAGWHPVIFTEYRSPVEEGMEFFNNLPEGLGEEINRMLPKIPNMVDEMRKAFGEKVSIYAGPANEVRGEELESFLTGEKDAMYMSYGAGGMGTNAQDKVGDAPRMGMFVELPWSGKMLEQGTRRTWRLGTKSNVVNVFFTTDALPEIKLLGTKILPRMASLEGAVKGITKESQFSRALRESVGLKHELMEYDEGQEYAPTAAEWEQRGDGEPFALLSDLEVPSAKDAMHKGMKYKGREHKLYQMPTEVTTSTRNEPDFKEWFSGSKVVGEDGQPLKVYHGTDKEFLSFKAGDSENSESDPAAAFGAFFTEIPEVANVYAAREGGNVRPVYLSLKNPYSMSLEERMSFKSKQEVEAKKSELTRAGHDGIIRKGNGGKIIEAVAFSPDQIKPAFGRKLFQMPPEDLDPFERAAQAAMEDLQVQIRNLPAPTARAVSANAGIINMEATEAGRRAMGSGEPVKEAAARKAKFIANDILLSDEMLISLHRGKGNLRNIGKFVQETGWMLATSGDKVVEKAFRSAGLPKLGEEMKRRIIDCDIRKGLYQGRMQAVIRDVVNGNDLKPAEIETMSKVVEGQTASEDPRINKAAKEFRQFTSDVRQALADAGSVVVIYEDGIRKEIPYSAIEEDPHYWPRMYDWNKEFVITDKATGARTITTLAEIMNMPTSDVRREKIIEQFAEDRGISKLQARQFFEKHDRGIRLAGNVERAREFNVPLYSRDRQAIERYIDQVATTLAVTEVHGQFRQKTDPLISQLPPYESGIVNRVITSDLDPAHLPPSDRVALSATSGLIITAKMLYSPLKVLTHIWKASLATNTRSVVAGLLKGVVKPGELFERARDCNALLDYSKSAWMREYGMKRGNIGQKFLDFNGFTMEIQFSRILSSATGRYWFERYAYPELVKHPDNQPLRRKLMDLYGMSEDHINNIVANGYGPDDVRRVELGAANWVTGSNRPSEMPPSFRPDKNASGVEFKLATLFRMSQMLHGFMFKTANMVNRTVFEELYKSNWKSIEPYHLIGRFAFNAGMAGWALEQLLYQRHKLQGSSEAEIEKHRHEWLMDHPASAEALWWSMANMSMAIGVQPLSDMFSELATRNPKDRQKLSTEHRPVKSLMGMPLGIPGQDAEALLTAAEDYDNTFADTGKHKQSPEERRKNILKRLLTEEVVGASLIPGTKPDKPVVHHGRSKKPSSRF